MRALCFAGDTGAGKTTLIERLLSHLPLDLDRVGVLKHTHHRLEWHPPGKDTTRFWQSDVRAVAVMDPLQLACFQRACESPASPTAELVAGCRLFPREVELALVEGFSQARAPKVWVAAHSPRSPGMGREGIPPHTRAIVTIESHIAAWSSEQPETLVFARDEVATIAAHVWEWAAEVDKLAAVAT